MEESAGQKSGCTFALPILHVLGGQQLPGGVSYIEPDALPGYSVAKDTLWEHVVDEYMEEGFAVTTGREVGLLWKQKAAVHIVKAGGLLQRLDN